MKKLLWENRMKSFSKIFFNKILIVTLVFLQVFFNSGLKLNAEPRHDWNNYKISMLQPQKVLAVADFSNDTGDPNMDYLKKGLANSLVTSLGATSNNNFSIVERGQFESIIKEMGLVNTGVIDVSTATKIGSALGATQVIVGGIIKLGSTFRLNIRVIEVKTSRLITAFTEYTHSENDILKLIDVVAQKIVNSLTELYPVSIPTPPPQPVYTQPPVSDSTKTEPVKLTPAAEQGIPVWVWIVGGVAVAGIVIFIVSAVTKNEPIPVYPPGNGYSYYPADSVKMEGFGFKF